MNLVNVTPVLTGVSTDTSKAYASTTDTSGSAQAWRAFDNKTDSAWTSGVRAKTAWLDLLLPVKTAVDYVKVINADKTRVPKKILVYGSNDRVTYELIHTISNIAISQYPLLFKIPRSNYKCYRLSFVESHLTTNTGYEKYYSIRNVYFYRDLDYRGVSQRIKNAVIETIQTHPLIQNLVTAEIEEE